MGMTEKTETPALKHEGDQVLETGRCFDAALFNDAEAAMLSLPQEDCPTFHYFGPGVYIRECIMRAGLFVLGHAHRAEDLNILVKGKVAILDDNGEVVIMQAPLCFVGRPGRKFALMLEDTVWHNIFANPSGEKDIEKLEEMFFDRTEVWKAAKSNVTEGAA